MFRISSYYIAIVIKYHKWLTVKERVNSTWIFTIFIFKKIKNSIMGKSMSLQFRNRTGNRSALSNVFEYESKFHRTRYGFLASFLLSKTSFWVELPIASSNNRRLDCSAPSGMHIPCQLNIKALIKDFWQRKILIF